MRAYERLLNYVRIHTTSDEASSTTPSTDRQFDLARLLEQEMKELGLTQVRVDEKCYVYGILPPSKGCENAFSLGLIAHLDTAPDFNAEHVRPQIHENYDGQDLPLGDSGRILETDMFPHLRDMKGATLITTDGTSLLGADDKAGIAEILTAIERLREKDLPHGKICICFSPDEEIGSGAQDLDILQFGADFAYTVDGGAENEIEYENFNAAAATFEICGYNIHPGDAKGKMINAGLLACEINRLLPGMETPAATEGYEGFFHLTQIVGTVEHAVMQYIIRDHSQAYFEARIATLKQIEKMMNERFGEGTVTLSVRQQYRNMKEKIEPCMHLVENAKESIRAMGMEPVTCPVRGGTDGAQLSFRGLPCPNLGTGGHAFHGPYEHITAESMDLAVGVILGIIQRYAVPAMR